MFVCQLHTKVCTQHEGQEFIMYESQSCMKVTCLKVEDHLCTLWVQNLIKVKIECGVNETNIKCTQLVQCKNIIKIHIKYLNITPEPIICMAEDNIMSYF